MTIAPDLPPPGVQSTADRVQIRSSLLVHAREELANGHRLQAGEKAWGAVVQPIKAIAEQRGWPHESHRDVREVIRQVALEYGFDHDQSEAISQAYWIGHENFYEIKYSIESLTSMIERVEDIAPYLNQLTAAQPPDDADITRFKRIRYRKASLLDPVQG